MWLFCDPMDYSMPSSSVHGISQATIQVLVAISFSRGSSQPRDQTCISCTYLQCKRLEIKDFALLTSQPLGQHLAHSWHQINIWSWKKMHIWSWNNNHNKNLEERGRLKGKGHMYTYDWFTLLYGRNQYDIVKQLSSNQKKKQKNPKRNALRPGRKNWKLDQ